MVAVAVAVQTVVEPLLPRNQPMGRPYSPAVDRPGPADGRCRGGSGVLLALAAQSAAAGGGGRGSDAVTRVWLAAKHLVSTVLLAVAILLLWNWFNLLSPRFTAIGDENLLPGPGSSSTPSSPSSSAPSASPSCADASSQPVGSARLHPYGSWRWLCGECPFSASTIWGHKLAGY